MSDLISRSELIKEINGIYIHVSGVRSGKGILSKCMDSYKELVIKTIKEQPTAFDTERVVEQIHDKYCHKCRNILGKQSSEEYCKSVKCEIDALCDIVKKGGAE